MGEDRSVDRDPANSSQALFLEVACTSSGKVRRFAAGTEAGFALCLINQKLGIGVPAALYIEATNDSEEPVSFGPNAILVNYGKEWKLRTVIEEGYEEAKLQQMSKPFPRVQKPTGSQSGKKSISGSSSSINVQYIGKILVAFAFIFLLGATLTLFLENLPRLIVFVTSSL